MPTDNDTFVYALMDDALRQSVRAVAQAENYPGNIVSLVLDDILRNEGKTSRTTSVLIARYMYLADDAEAFAERLEQKSDFESAADKWIRSAEWALADGRKEDAKTRYLRAGEASRKAAQTYCTELHTPYEQILAESRQEERPPTYNELFNRRLRILALRERKKPLSVGQEAEEHEIFGELAKHYCRVAQTCFAIAEHADEAFGLLDAGLKHLKTHPEYDDMHRAFRQRFLADREQFRRSLQTKPEVADFTRLPIEIGSESETDARDIPR